MLIVIFRNDLLAIILLLVIDVFFLGFFNFIIVFAGRMLSLVLLLVMVVLAIVRRDRLSINWFSLVAMLLLDISHHVEVLVGIASSSFVW